MTTFPDIYSGGYVRPMRYETEPSEVAVYRYFIADTLTGELIAEIPYTNVTWSLGVSKAGEFSGSIPVAGAEVVPGLDLYDATLPLRRSLFIMREGNTVWGGFLSSRSYNRANRVLNVNAAGFEAYLFRRYIWHTLAYPAGTDQYEVARGLIDAMQSDFEGLAIPADRIQTLSGPGNIGIQYETRNSGHFQETDSQAWIGGELKSFGDALKEFANNMYGFEWNIVCDWDADAERFTKTLTFRDAPPSLLPTGVEYVGPRPGLDENIFEDPGNIMSLSLNESGDDSCIRYIVLGGVPAGVDTSYRPRGYWNNQEFANNGWPLFELIESSRHSTTSNVTSLDRYAEVYGRYTKPVTPTWEVTVNGRLDPMIGTYSVGDWCRLVVHDEFISKRLRLTDEDGSGIIKRIMGLSVSVPDVPQEPETVKLDLEDEWEG